MNNKKISIILTLLLVIGLSSCNEKTKKNTPNNNVIDEKMIDEVVDKILDIK